MKTVFGTFVRLLYCPITVFCFSNTTTSVCLSAIPQSKITAYCLLPFLVSELPFLLLDFEILTLETCMEKKLALKLKCMKQKAGGSMA